MTLSSLLQSLRALEAKATQAPWEREPDDLGIFGRNYIGAPTLIAQVATDFPDNNVGSADADLIVALRNSAPDLLAAAEAVEEMRNQVFSAREELANALTCLPSAREFTNQDVRDCITGTHEAIDSSASILTALLAKLDALRKGKG